MADWLSGYIGFAEITQIFLQQCVHLFQQITHAFKNRRTLLGACRLKLPLQL
jgi:hypothetical protein